MTTFSVIIPVYNTIQELERCVNSVIRQTYPHWECILVDDGSTDGSSVLCDKLCQSDRRLRVIHKPNGGSSDARNMGVRSAVGEYVLFLDSDDMWSDENALEGLFSVIQNSPNADEICFGVSIYEENGQLAKTRQVSMPDCFEKQSVLRHLIYRNEYFGACYARALRRDFFESANLYFTKGLLSGEDIEWVGRVMVSSQNVAVYPSAFYKRIRGRAGAITSSIGRKNILDLIRGLEMGLEQVESSQDSEEMKQLYREYWAYQYAMILALLPKLSNEPDYEAIIEQVKQYRYLLKLDHYKKVKMVHWATSLLGFRGGIWLLDKYINRR